MIFGASPYLGDPQLSPTRLLRGTSGDGLLELFAGRRAFWSYNTRVAIRAACDVLGLVPGDEVLAPAYNCGSDLDPLANAGLHVTLYPVSKDLRADPARIAPLINERTRAIYVIHYFGILQPDLKALRILCDERGLRLIEDAALSLLSGSEPVEGRVGDVSVFCFHKFVPVPAGGALVVNASDIEIDNPFPRSAPAKPVLRMVTRGALADAIGPTLTKRLARRVKGGDTVVPAVRGELENIPQHYYFNPDLAGRRISAITLRLLRSYSAHDIIAVRRENWSVYREMLDGLPGVEMLTPDLNPGTCPLNMPVMLDDRDAITRTLKEKGIGVTPWWAGFNRNLDWSDQGEAMLLKNRAMSLPLHQGLRPAEIECVVKALRDAIKHRWRKET